jgi:hypothetical protein
MSYARFGDSDIYLYASIGGGIFCDMCCLQGEARMMDTYDDAIAHVRKHIDAGHRVPESVIPRLEAERDAGESLLVVMDIDSRGDAEAEDA